MKKILAALLVLALVAPAMADVAVTADDLGSGHLRIKIAPTGGAVVRGVALVLENANGATVANTSAVTATGLNTHIDYAFTTGAGYTIGMTGQHPAAKWNDHGVAVFPADSAKFSLCAGYLDQGGNQAGLTVDSFFDVYYTLSVDTTVAISLDTLRGGIVGDTLGNVTVEASQLLDKVDAEVINGTLVFAKTTAAPAINTRVNGGRVETFTAAGVSGSLGGALEYQFTWGDGTTSSWGAATQNKTYTYTAAATYNVSVKARLVATPAVEVTSTAVALTTEEVKSTATFYAAWAQFGRPNCWAYQRNCRGDTNALATGLGVNRAWVNSADLTILAAGFNKVEAQLAAVNNGICADFNRLATGLGVNRAWVNSADLTILANYFNKVEASVPVCGLANLHYYTN